MGVRLSGGNLGSVCLLSRKEILVANAVLNLVEGNIFSILIVRRTSRRMICPLNFSKVTSQSSLIFNLYNFFTYSRSLSSTSTIPWTSVTCYLSLFSSLRVVGEWCLHWFIWVLPFNFNWVDRAKQVLLPLTPKEFFHRYILIYNLLQTCITACVYTHIIDAHQTFFAFMSTTRPSRPFYSSFS